MNITAINVSEAIDEVKPDTAMEQGFVNKPENTNINLDESSDIPEDTSVKEDSSEIQIASLGLPSAVTEQEKESAPSVDTSLSELNIPKEIETPFDSTEEEVQVAGGPIKTYDDWKKTRDSQDRTYSPLEKMTGIPRGAPRNLTDMLKARKAERMKAVKGILKKDDPFADKELWEKIVYLPEFANMKPFELKNLI